MAEYIEREAVLATRVWVEEADLNGFEYIPVHAVKAILAADVAPVVRGRWERTQDGAAYCTACKRKMNPSQYGYAFCGLCGAKMDGERKGDDAN